MLQILLKFTKRFFFPSFYYFYQPACNEFGNYFVWRLYHAVVITVPIFSIALGKRP